MRSCLQRGRTGKGGSAPIYIRGPSVFGSWRPKCWTSHEYSRSKAYLAKSLPQCWHTKGLCPRRWIFLWRVRSPSPLTVEDGKKPRNENGHALGHQLTSDQDLQTPELYSTVKSQIAKIARNFGSVGVMCVHVCRQIKFPAKRSKANGTDARECGSGWNVEVAWASNLENSTPHIGQAYAFFLWPSREQISNVTCSVN